MGLFEPAQFTMSQSQDDNASKNENHAGDIEERGGRQGESIERERALQYSGGDEENDAEKFARLEDGGTMGCCGRRAPPLSS